MKEEITKPKVIYCDNTSVINIFKNHVMHIKKKNCNQVSLIKRASSRQRSKSGICEHKGFV